MIAETLYWIAKIYFMIAGIYYLYALYTGNLDTFAHVTGVIAILFLISNIFWYFLKK